MLVFLPDAEESVHGADGNYHKSFEVNGKIYFSALPADADTSETPQVKKELSPCARGR